MRFILVTAVIFLVGCGGDPKPKPTAQSASVTVQVATVSSQLWPDTYEATGSVRARTTAVLSSKVMAYVRQVSVQIGDHVREGQELIVLDAQDLESNVRRAQAALAEVQSAFPEADHAIAGAKANLDLAQSTFRRMEELAGKKSISSQEFDEASARLKSAQANYEMVRSKRAQLDARLALAEQEIRSARIMRDYTRLAAPFAGTVTTKTVESGNLASPGTPLLTIERDGAYRLEVAVDESKAAMIKSGQSVEVSLDEQRVPGRVSEIVPAVDAASRAYLVKIDLPVVANLRSGMFGRAWFGTGTRNVMTVPASAVVERGQLQSVYVIEDGFAHNRLVTTGKRGVNGVEVLSGLSDNEKIVSPAIATLADGSRVEVRP